MMAPLLAPMVRRMPISRPLSFTSMMRPEMMLNAATTTITDRMMNIMLRSTSSTVKKLSFRWRQSEKCSARDAGLASWRPSCSPTSSGSATNTSSTSTASPLLKIALRLGERHEDHGAVVLGHAHLEHGRHLVGLDARRRAEGRRRRPRGDTSVTRVADVDAQRIGKPRADGDALLAVEAVEACRSGYCWRSRLADFRSSSRMPRTRPADAPDAAWRPWPGPRSAAPPA